MKLKQLESALQSVDTFISPKVHLEQYQTSPHLAARILHSISSRFGSIREKCVLDLGCGSGIFSVGSVLLEAEHVVGVDIDPEALEVCRGNLEQCLDDDLAQRCDLIQADVTELTSLIRMRKSFDTVIMNPPFGTKNNNGLDMTFLTMALDMATDSVYSLHKTSTRKFINKKCEEWDVKMEVLSHLKFDLPSTYKFHKLSTKNIDVDFIRFSNIPETLNT